jgi:hypothetical protein
MAFGRTALEPQGAARSSSSRSQTKRPAAKKSATKAGAKRPAKSGGRIERRYHQTVRSIDVWSVLKVSLCFYLSALVVLLVAGVVLWFAADALGFVHNVESFMGDLVEDSSYHFRAGDVLRAATLLGLVFVALSTVMTVLAAAFYNLFSDLVGGVEITVAEEA